MSKELKWNVTVDGCDHCVSCRATGNKYEIWVDDSDLTVVYRPSFRRMGRGLEHELKIGGKSCLFLVWDERPDLVVDGVLQYSGKDYLKEKAKRKRVMVRTLWGLTAFGAVVLGYAIVSLCLGLREDPLDWIDSAVYILAGLWIIVDARLDMKYWKEQ